MNMEPTLQKIKTIKLKRIVEREVTVLRKFKEDVDVPLSDITEPDLDSIKDVELLRIVAIAFKRLYDEYRDISKEQSKVIQKFLQEEPPRDIIVPPLDTVVPDTGFKSVETKTVSGHPHEGIVGNKKGVTSEYHYVFFDKTKECWKTTFESQCHKNEIDAALGADLYLTRTIDTKRPMNRNEFPEVMTAYTVKGGSNNEAK